MCTQSRNMKLIRYVYEVSTTRTPKNIATSCSIHITRSGDGDPPF